MYRPRETWVEHGRTYTVCSVCQRLLFETDRDANGACCFCEDKARIANTAEVARLTQLADFANVPAPAPPVPETAPAPSEGQPS